MLTQTLLLAGLIASPQLYHALRYYPHSIRAGKSAAQKMELGNIPLSRLLRNLIAPTVEPIAGVFGPEAMTFIGLPALWCLPWAHSTFWWGVGGISLLLAMGKSTPLFPLTHRLHLRIPARYCYFLSLALAFLSLEALKRASRPFGPLSPSWLTLLQMGSLVLTLPRLWPMLPYVQRWDSPERAFHSPLASSLFAKTGGYRVSGLPYPLRTGQVNQFMTLGYNGGSQAKWMAAFRQDPNPNGSGGHDWFKLNEDGPLLDWYGVKYAYTYRPLRGKWKPTQIRHLYENTQAQSPPTWKEVQAHYELRSTHRDPL